MESRKRALGRGIASLIPQSKAGASTLKPQESEQMPASSVSAPEGPFREVPISQIKPYANQPRKFFDEDKIEELAKSIKLKGLIHPLLVRTVAGGYELISGERRWRAAKKIGLEQVPVLVRDVAEQEQLELALIENLQRADLDPIEEAIGFAELMEKFGLKQEDVAERVSRSRSAVANSLRLLRLPEKVQAAVRTGEISIGHAKVLLGESIDRQLMLLEKIIENRLTVRGLELLVNSMHGKTKQPAAPASSSPRSGSLSPALVRIVEELQKRLGTQVQLEPTDKGGRIIVEYYSDEQLDELYQRMTGYHLTRRKTTSRGI